jgi:threonine/homoserine/homoserine lactone efflux protein
MIIALLCGCAFGFISAIPIAGPISALVLNLAINGKYAQGRYLALGAAIAESIYTFLAFLGVSQVLNRYKYLGPVSNALAALILAGLGIHFYRSQKMRSFSHQPAKKSDEGQKEFLTGIGVSAANPTLIATWTTVITTLYSMKLFPLTTPNSAFFAGGVCLGIFGWFNVLIALLAKYRSHLNPRIMDKILKTIGVLLGAISVWIVIGICRNGFHPG